MSLILNIETSTKTCSVSLAKDGQTIICIEETSDQYIHAEKLNVFIENLFNKSGLSIDKLDAVCVSKGPGSFTGLRIGVASAKGFCYALDIPLLSIDSLTVLTHQYLQNNQVGEIDLMIPMIDARRMEVYTTVFNAKKNMIAPISPKIIDEKSFSEYTVPIHLFGDGAEKCKSVLSATNVHVHNSLLTSASAMSSLSYQKYKNKEYEDLAYFDPFYLKDFVAGVKKT